MPLPGYKDSILTFNVSSWKSTTCLKSCTHTVVGMYLFIEYVLVISDLFLSFWFGGSYRRN